MKARLVTLLEWHARAVDPSVDTWHGGRFLERWADPGALAALERAYAHYDLRDVARALWETIDLFQGLEEETASRLGLDGRARPRRPPASRSPRSSPTRVARLPSGRERALVLARVLALAGRRVRRWRRRGDADRHRATTTAPAETHERSASTCCATGRSGRSLREVEETEAVATAALEELLAGPTADETAELDFTTAIPDGVERRPLDDRGRGRHASHCPPSSRRGARPGRLHADAVPDRRVRSRSRARRYTRADFEDLTPAILVESPLSFEEVVEPAARRRARRTPSRRRSTTSSRTPTGGSSTRTSSRRPRAPGTRGTFDFTTDAFEIPFDGVGALIVFESSAKDGSRINLVEIPLRMAQ